MTKTSRRMRRLRLLGAATIAMLLLSDIAAFAQTKPAPPPKGNHGSQRPPQTSPGRPPSGGGNQGQTRPPSGGGATQPRPPSGGGNATRPPSGNGNATRPPSGGGNATRPPQTSPGRPPATRPPTTRPPSNAHRPPAYHHPGAGRPPNFRPIHRPTYVYPRGYSYRRWGIGTILPSVFMASTYYFYDYTMLGVGRPPSGYIWVRYGPDLLLVRTRDRHVVDVIYGAFY